MKRIFLTGASSGIGRAMAETLTARGDEVWGTARDLNRLPSMERFHPVKLDLSDPVSIERAFQSALSEAGHFDVVINNAGSGHFGPAESLSHEDIANQFQVLVFGQLQLMRLALPTLRAQGHGLIVNVTSLAARLPVPFMAAYNSAKAAMASFTMSMQMELFDSRVRAIDLQPADINTAFNDAVQKGSPPSHYGTKVDQTWATVDRNMKAAPGPELVARRLAALIDQANPPPRLTVGDAFQSRVAPFIFRFLPQRVRLWGLKQYYRL